MSIQYDKAPSGRYRALAKGTNSGYGLEVRAWGKTKAEAKTNLLKLL